MKGTPLNFSWVRRSVLFEGGSGFALGENPKAPAPFVTWQFNDTDRGRSYFWGHYHADKAAAELDFNSRVADHKRLYGQREVTPRPIAQQMQEAAKLAEADRGQTAPKRNVPDKGDR